MGGTLFESTIYKKIIYVHKKAERVPRSTTNAVGVGDAVERRYPKLTKAGAVGEVSVKIFSSPSH